MSTLSRCDMRLLSTGKCHDMWHLSTFAVFTDYPGKSESSGYHAYFPCSDQLPLCGTSWCFCMSQTLLWGWSFLMDLLLLMLFGLHKRWHSSFKSLFHILLLVCSLFFKSQIQLPVILTETNALITMQNMFYFTNQLDSNILFAV